MKNKVRRDQAIVPVRTFPLAPYIRLPCRTRREASHVAAKCASTVRGCGGASFSYRRIVNRPAVRAWWRGVKRYDNAAPHILRELTGVGSGTRRAPQQDYFIVGWPAIIGSPPRRRALRYRGKQYWSSPRRALLP